jgi:hypothetical protein
MTPHRHHPSSVHRTRSATAPPSPPVVPCPQTTARPRLARPPPIHAAHSAAARRGLRRRGGGAAAAALALVVHRQVPAAPSLLPLSATSYNSSTSSLEGSTLSPGPALSSCGRMDKSPPPRRAVRGWRPRGLGCCWVPCWGLAGVNHGMRFCIDCDHDPSWYDVDSIGEGGPRRAERGGHGRRGKRKPSALGAASAAAARAAAASV